MVELSTKVPEEKLFEVSPVQLEGEAPQVTVLVAAANEPTKMPVTPWQVANRRVLPESYASEAMLPVHPGGTWADQLPPALVEDATPN